MSVTLQESRVSILVKALPQRSANHGETVCCAGVTASGEFKRLFPIRFRHLTKAATFKRWDWVNYKFRRPTSDRRSESCHVMEDTITVDGKLRETERSQFLNPLVSSSIFYAHEAGKSLGLIRPTQTEFYWKAKKADQIESERRAYAEAARQGSFFDEDLIALEPSPYDFRFKFVDGTGSHDYANGDWEAHAMFFKGRQRLGSDDAALNWMSTTFNDEYPKRGMLFCVGNIAKRPQTWQLLGILRVDATPQQALF